MDKRKIIFTTLVAVTVTLGAVILLRARFNAAEDPFQSPGGEVPFRITLQLISGGRQFWANGVVRLAGQGCSDTEEGLGLVLGTATCSLASDNLVRGIRYSNYDDRSELFLPVNKITQEGIKPFHIKPGKNLTLRAVINLDQEEKLTVYQRIDGIERELDSNGVIEE